MSALKKSSKNIKRGGNQSSSGLNTDTAHSNSSSPLKKQLPSVAVGTTNPEISVVEDIVTSLSHHLSPYFHCAICLGIISESRISPECGHRFCGECIKESLRKCKNECPTCRISIPTHRSLREDRLFDNMARDFGYVMESIEKKLVELKQGVPESEGQYGVGCGKDEDKSMSRGESDDSPSSQSHSDALERSLNRAAHAPKISHRLLVSRQTHSSESSDEEASDAEFKVPKRTANYRSKQTEISRTSIAARRPTRMASAQEAIFNLSSSSESEGYRQKRTPLKNQRLPRRKRTKTKSHAMPNSDLALIGLPRRTQKKTQRFGCLVNNDDVDKILECPSNVLTWIMVDAKEEVNDEDSEGFSDEASDESEDSLEIQGMQSHSRSSELLTGGKQHFISSTQMRSERRRNRAESKNDALHTKTELSEIELFVSKNDSDFEIDETSSEFQILTARKHAIPGNRRVRSASDNLRSSRKKRQSTSLI